ncbi:XTP/dITP diphosphatase [Fusibacter bizertensis]|uniref:dITP/XTP pyrophosphatase n=2 Tax=Fusibacter bizertensis TaxID=1488331 RepID=A0ABT6NEW6_9FIRM|nr:XTP/dITP diphosphatase [Fusibacter bizertensis]MDH8678941.1 XTP/dITP diphosphatase [Fusibacter bizertensis]
MMKKIILASGNQHKLKEIQSILKDFEFELVTMADAGFGDEEIIEDGDTFEANSLIKAKAVYEKLGLASLADDSGLSVDFLGGAPGVYSARYSGEPKSDQRNNEKLLAALKDVPLDQRTARFVTVITLMFENGDTLVARGEVEGRIGFEPSGSNGFGYDPLFEVPALGKTFAELTEDQKNAMSHRGNALIVLKQMIREYYESTSNK